MNEFFLQTIHKHWVLLYSTAPLSTPHMRNVFLWKLPLRGTEGAGQKYVDFIDSIDIKFLLNSFCFKISRVGFLKVLITDTISISQGNVDAKAQANSEIAPLSRYQFRENQLNRYYQAILLLHTFVISNFNNPCMQVFEEIWVTSQIRKKNQ